MLVLHLLVVFDLMVHVVAMIVYNLRKSLVIHELVMLDVVVVCDRLGLDFVSGCNHHEIDNYMDVIVFQ